MEVTSCGGAPLFVEVDLHSNVPVYILKVPNKKEDRFRRFEQAVEAYNEKMQAMY